jgi:hypothetical protein
MEFVTEDRIDNQVSSWLFFFFKISIFDGGASNKILNLCQ